VIIPATTPTKIPTPSAILSPPIPGLPTQSILLAITLYNLRHINNKSPITHKGPAKSILFTRKTPQDKCTTTGLLSSKQKGSQIFSQSQNQFTMAFLSQILESGIKIFMILPEAMPNTRSQSNHFTHTRAKFNMDTTKLREISNQVIKIGLLKILNPTTVSIQIHQLMIRPTFNKAITLFHNIPDLNQGFHIQCSRKSSSLKQIFLY
jgi:hypothetical protein